MQFEPESQLEIFCRNYVYLYVSCTIRVETKMSDVYFVTNRFSLFYRKYSDCCKHAPPSVANR